MVQSFLKVDHWKRFLKTTAVGESKQFIARDSLHLIEILVLELILPILFLAAVYIVASSNSVKIFLATMSFCFAE